MQPALPLHPSALTALPRIAPRVTLDYFTLPAAPTPPLLLSAIALGLTVATYALYEFWLNLWPALTRSQDLSPLSLTCYATLLLAPLLAILLGLLAFKSIPRALPRATLPLLMAKLSITLSALFLVFAALILFTA